MADGTAQGVCCTTPALSTSEKTQVGSCSQLHPRVFPHRTQVTNHQLCYSSTYQIRVISICQIKGRKIYCTKHFKVYFNRALNISQCQVHKHLLGWLALVCQKRLICLLFFCFFLFFPFPFTSFELMERKKACCLQGHERGRLSRGRTAPVLSTAAMRRHSPRCPASPTRQPRLSPAHTRTAAPLNPSHSAPEPQPQHP